jgi:FMN reductase
MSTLVLSTNLNPGSGTMAMAQRLADAVASAGGAGDLMDLSQHAMPFCDGYSCYQDERVKPLAERVRAAAGVLIATPIYNYTINAALKNFIELTGDAWDDKVVGFACSAGGPMSYMAVMSCANWLMLDYRCVIVPRFVYATKTAFTNRQLTDDEVVRRLDELAATHTRMTAALGAK